MEPAGRVPCSSGLVANTAVGFRDPGIAKEKKT